MMEQDALTAFSALSNETRLRILKELVKAGPSGLPAGVIADRAGATPSRASFHLAALSQAGLVAQDKIARNINYRVEFTAIGALARFLLHDCCADHPQARACC